MKIGLMVIKEFSLTEGKKMKKISILILMAVLLAGCSAGARFDFYGQSSSMSHVNL
ncbi:MAG: hypothetical protein ACHQJ6_01590 [Candidatus Berkiellales bacterium]